MIFTGLNVSFTADMGQLAVQLRQLKQAEIFSPPG
jgi:hypothetical protein